MERQRRGAQKRFRALVGEQTLRVFGDSRVVAYLAVLVTPDEPAEQVVVFDLLAKRPHALDVIVGGTDMSVVGAPAVNPASKLGSGVST
jgi:hypothetical protein